MEGREEQGLAGGGIEPAHEIKNIDGGEGL